MHGVINFLKPPGMTSHDAVALVRRLTRIKRVGHTGTLDPAAAGVLPICIGLATRLVEYLQAGTKEYIAEITFGYETDTLDATGTVISRLPTEQVNLESLRQVLDNFLGTITQTPPLYSAIKQDGKKLYELARAGVNIADVEIKAREVTISRLGVTEFWKGSVGKLPHAMLHIECSSGTYIRSLVRDIGQALGCSATMTFLVRTRSGTFALNTAVTGEHLAGAVTQSLQPILDVLPRCADHVVTDDAALTHLINGRKATGPPGTKGRTLFLSSDGTKAALSVVVDATGKTTLYQPEKVFLLDNICPGGQHDS